MRIPLLAALLILTTPAFAVQPDEILKDPTLESRARSISAGLRCLVCQNQSIDDSDAPVARDLRILIREQLQKDKSDVEIVDFVVARYGDYVLLKPRLSAQTALLWFSPFVILFVTVFLLWRGRKSAAPVHNPLNASEMAALDDILRK